MCLNSVVLSILISFVHDMVNGIRWIGEESETARRYAKIKILYLQFAESHVGHVLATIATFVGMKLLFLFLFRFYIITG